MSTDPAMRSAVQCYATALKTFSSSPSPFRILSPAPSPSPSPLPPPNTLYILDSSFNPPTLAHLRIATFALLHDTHVAPAPKRLLLLLATQNADKAPKPAAFEQRLLTMQRFASDLLASLHTASQRASQGGGDESDALPAIGVDIGVTKLPYFIDKATAIEDSGAYPARTPQVHLTGFDTLIRILDPKYYPPAHTLEPLEPFLAKHRLRVTYRTDDQWGARAAQDEYLAEIGEGRREQEGAKREWVREGRIELVEGRAEGEEAVSSTRVREAVRDGDEVLLRKLVTAGVADWILEEGLYKDG